MVSTEQSSTLTAPTALTEFQKDYSTFIRSPSKNSCPKGVPIRPSKVYEELVFNNTQGFINQCFPVAKSLFTAEQWLYLVKLFFQNWSCHTPYFSQIPLEFVQFINSKPAIDHSVFSQGAPDWLGSLLHYEWVELDVELSKHIVQTSTKTELTKECKLKANPTLMNLQYDWPVHNISNDNLPEQPVTTHLLVYRTPEHQVEFIEVNALTSALINIFETQACTIDKALNKLSKIVPNISNDKVFEFGRPLIGDLFSRKTLLPIQ